MVFQIFSKMEIFLNGFPAQFLTLKKFVENIKEKVLSNSAFLVSSPQS
jgi:hypothetical protein